MELGHTARRRRLRRDGLWPLSEDWTVILAIYLALLLGYVLGTTP